MKGWYIKGLCMLGLSPHLCRHSSQDSRCPSYIAVNTTGAPHDRYRFGLCIERHLCSLPQNTATLQQDLRCLSPLLVHRHTYSSSSFDTQALEDMSLTDWGYNILNICYVSRLYLNRDGIDNLHHLYMDIQWVSPSDLRSSSSHSPHPPNRQHHRIDRTLEYNQRLGLHGLAPDCWGFLPSPHRSSLLRYLLPPRCYNPLQSVPSSHL